MFRLPSLKNFITGIQQIILRFPMVVLVAAINLATVIYLIELPEVFTSVDWATPILLTCFLAVPLFISTHLVAERRQWTTPTKVAALAGVLALLVVYYFWVGFELVQRDYYRFGMFFVCAHLLVSFAPFIGYYQTNGFWHYNKALLAQLFGATLYAGTLFVGIIIAIETARFLFGSFTHSLLGSLEMYIFFITFLLLHPLFFLYGLPDRLDTLEVHKTYPLGVKVFTQYLLLPLVVAYLLILYVYSAKILVQWQLPEGGVAYLVMAFSVAGVLALLLVYPLRENSDERWIRLFTNRFYLALFPLIVLLFIAIYRRIHDYGITENRYLVAALAIWLAGISVYFLVSKKEDIRWIPVSLFAFSFLMAIGPWSIFSVSRRDQLQRFSTLLRETKLLDDRGIFSGEGTVSKEEYDQLISGVRFFRDRRESQALRPFFSALPPGDDHIALAQSMEKQIQKISRKEGDSGTLANETLSYHLNTSENEVSVNIGGFDVLSTVEIYGNQSHDYDQWKIKSTQYGARLTVLNGTNEVVTWDIGDRLSQLHKQYEASYYEVAPASLTFNATNVRLILTSISKNGTTFSYKGFLLRKNR